MPPAASPGSLQTVSQKAAATSQKAVRTLAWALVVQLLCRSKAQDVSTVYTQQQASTGSALPPSALGSQATQPPYFIPQPALASAAGGANSFSPPAFWPATSQSALTYVEDTVFTPGMQPIDTSGNWVSPQTTRCLMSKQV